MAQRDHFPVVTCADGRGIFADVASVDRFDELADLMADHEQVVFAHDSAVGLHAVIAVHSTTLGPALGGTRMRSYPSAAAAVRDVLNLATAMTYKNSLAGVDHGGGKAVIIGDPAHRPAGLLHAYADFVQGLAGRYITACDVGTTVADMDVVAERCRYVTGRSPAQGGAGDSGILTALGVFHGMRAAVDHRFGEGHDLSRLRIGVVGVGKVGRRLVDHLVREGVTVVITDPNDAAVAGVIDRHPDVAVAPDLAALLAADLDVLSPNALGGLVTERLAHETTASIICGGANNQLANPDLAEVLASRDVLFAPDYLVNCGGVIAVADEWLGYDDARATQAVVGVYDTARRVFAAAAESGRTPLAAANELALARISAGSPAAWRPGT